MQSPEATMKRLVRYSLFWLALILAAPANANVKPNGLFTDNAVLQQKIPVPVWGDARSGEKVTVTFQKQVVSTTAKDGRWNVVLKPLKAGGSFEMTIQGDNTVTLKNVLVGEVWLASGQSNMQMDLRSCFDPAEAIATSKDPMLRLYTVPRRPLDQPVLDVDAKWEECGPETVPGFSGVAYYFGRDLRKSRKVPVGMISTNVGGTPAEAWTRREVLWADPELKTILTSYAERLGNFEKAMLDFSLAEAKAKERGETIPRAPQNSPANYQRPCGLYNAMIAPLVPYAISGAIWYQGESNAGAAYQYRKLFPAMITNWRKDWNQGDFAFLFVQLAPFLKINPEPMDSAWAELREAQHMTTKNTPKTGEAVITDVGDEVDIHPKKKEPVGARLALAARTVQYKEKIEFSGPDYQSMTNDINKAVLVFTHAKGLSTSDGKEVKGFTIAGPDRKFYNAQAKIEGNKVIVWSDRVSTPASVRYGWANFPVVNLQNGAGLPASPFRTDDWPITTGPR
jgi:sialate O-acetylesterase